MQLTDEGDRNYVAYYRVSTEEQGQSGLGLEAQKSAVRGYVSGKADRYILEEYQDVESGKNIIRDGLMRAIDSCVEFDAILLIKNVSRLSREGFTIMDMLESRGITYIAVDSPFDPSLLKEIRFLLSKEEGRKISENTKAALSQIKEKFRKGKFHISKAGNKIYSLGNPENLGVNGVPASIASRKKKAKENANNKSAYKTIKLMRRINPSITYLEMRNNLNESGIKTSGGKSFRDSEQVKRVIRLYEGGDEDKGNV